MIVQNLNTNTKALRGIIFDLDGTLVDTIVDIISGTQLHQQGETLDARVVGTF